MGEQSTFLHATQCNECYRMHTKQSQCWIRCLQFQQGRAFDLAAIINWNLRH